VSGPEELWRFASLPFFGLPSDWPGIRYRDHIGGLIPLAVTRSWHHPKQRASSPLVMNDVAMLGHRRGEEEILVTTRRVTETGPDPRTRLERVLLTRYTSDSLSEGEVIGTVDLEDRVRDSWFPTAIIVDGLLRTCEVARLGRRWVALISLNGFAVTIEASGVEPDTVSLIRITDLSAYGYGAPPPIS